MDGLNGSVLMSMRPVVRLEIFWDFLMEIFRVLSLGLYDVQMNWTWHEIHEIHSSL